MIFNIFTDILFHSCIVNKSNICFLGLYKLAVNNNPLYNIKEDALSGLERSLWELELRYDHLPEVPNKSLRYLQKLKHLDLTGNKTKSIISSLSFLHRINLKCMFKLICYNITHSFNTFTKQKYF